MASRTSTAPPFPTEGVAHEGAPAKINLDLLVTGRRADGFHLLDSLVVFARPGDRVTLTPCETLALDLRGPFAGALADAPGDNLALGAVRLLAAHAGRPAKLRVGLDKRLPVAAGLGGGSADAAAVLRGLARLWRLGLDCAALAALSLPLGADLPACVLSRPLRMTGIGERLVLLDGVAPLALVLVHPGVALATRDVFQALGPPPSAPRDRLPALDDPAGLVAALAASRNDLEMPARRLCPPVGEVLEALGSRPGCRLARMSGSGAACFGLFADSMAARAAARDLAAHGPGWWITPATLA
jgi:4-diphosphocytidyl-2-C-methyl-D-erythritol kinase